MTPLRQRMLEDMGIRNLAANTQLSYLQQVSLYAGHFHRSPEELGPEEVRAYQVHLTKTRKLAPSSVGIATSALRFLYKVTLKREWAPDDIPMPKKAFKLPIVLSPEEVVHFLACVDSLKRERLAVPRDVTVSWRGRSELPEIRRWACASDAGAARRYGCLDGWEAARSRHASRRGGRGHIAWPTAPGS